MKEFVKKFLSKQILLGSLAVKTGTVVATAVAVIVVGTAVGVIAVNGNAPKEELVSSVAETLAESLTGETEQTDSEIPDETGNQDSNQADTPQEESNDNSNVEEPAQEAHVHTFTTEIVSQSTCTTRGEAVDTCSECGYSHSYQLPSAGHERGEWVVVSEATQTKEGLREQHCNQCGTLLASEVIAVIPHNHTYVVTSSQGASCEKDGYNRYTCTVCGSFYAETIGATGHKYDEQIVVDSTCSAEGNRKFSCTRENCGYFYEEVIAKKDHTESDWIGNNPDLDKAPTCTEAGRRHTECKECHAVIRTEEIPATGHSFGAWTTITAPACESAGEEKRICQVCNVEETRTIPALGHKFVNYVEVIRADDLTEGLERAACENGCGKTDDRIIEKLPHTHNYDIEKERVEAECTQDGYYIMECRCGLTDKIILPRTNHRNAEWKTTKEATYTEIGLREKICPDCLATIEKEDIPVKPHEHTYTVTSSTEATCTEAGTTVKTCSICGNTTTVITPATGHTEGAFLVDKEATCTETGMKHTECSVCHITLTTGTIPATGHFLNEWHETVVAKCETAGTEQRNCSNCSYAESRSIPALGHDYGDWIIDKEATEESEGEKHKECSRCDSKITEDIEKLPPHVHSYTETARTDSTCTKTGTITYTCDCGDSYTEEIAKKAHTPGGWTVKTPATEESSGLEVKICSVCQTETDSRVIDKLPHTHKYTTETKPATCTEDGYEKQTCACGSIINTVLPATGHHYVESEKTAATCGHAGSVTYKCSNCGDTYSESIDQLEHDYAVTSTVEATCTEGGYTLETCKNCGDAKKTNETEAVGHDDGEWTTTAEAQLGVAGAKELRCTKCQALLDTQEIPMLMTDGTDSVYYYEVRNEDGTKSKEFAIGHYNEEEAQEMLELVNAHRESLGAAVLTTPPAHMTEYTALRAVETSKLWDHTRPAGYGCEYSENIALGNPDMKGVNPSVQEIFDAWLASEGHRNNIEYDNRQKNWTSISVFYKRCPVYKNGVETGQYVYTAYWVETFK